jgi:putative aldouronate transport system substrate-binding protein
MKKRIVSFALIIMLAAAAVNAGSRPQADTSGVTTLSIFIDHSWYPVESFTGIIPDEITRLTGIRLEPTIAINDQQLGVMIASGDLPDLVYTQTKTTQMSDSTVSWSYEELIQKYKTGWNIPAKQLGIGRGLSEDGKAYTILNHYSEKSDWVNSQSVPMTGSVLYRTDLYEAIGSPPMRNFDEFFDVLTKIKAANPNLGAVLKLNDQWNLGVLAANIGLGSVNPNEYSFIEQPNGQYIWYSLDPRFKEVLAFVNKCWRAGFISADESYFVRGSTVPAAGDWFASLGCTQNQLPDAIADHQKINPNYRLKEMVPFTTASFVTSDVGWSGTFITKNCKDPEKAIKFMQWMFSPEAQALTQMGRKGIEYTLNASGMPNFNAEWKAALADGTHDKVYNPWFYLGGSETVESDSRVAPTDPALVADAYKVMRERFDNYPWVAAARPIGSSNEKVILDKIAELTVTYNPRIIMAGSPAQFETLYTEFVTNANRTGLPQLETWVNNKIKQVMPMYK